MTKPRTANRLPLAHWPELGARRSNRRRQALKAAALPGKVYAPGHFTEPVRAWAQMQFVSQLPTVDMDAVRKRSAMIGRQASIANGSGWGNGTLDMLGTPITAAPGWMP